MITQRFVDVIAWQRAHQFVLAVYQATQAFPREGIYTLTSQFRRAAISVPANIAEGFKKRGTADKFRFYNISEGSLEECRYYLILASDLGYLADPQPLEESADEVARLLSGYINAIRTDR